MWKILVLPRLHIFLWLLANNKTLTRDNLAKRRNVDDKSCLFCSEPESVLHLFHECYVPKAVWSCCYEVTDIELGGDFESVAKFWLSVKKFNALNVFTSAVLWAIWKTRNDICF
jgi:hypothetical protein